MHPPSPGSPPCSPTTRSSPPRPAVCARPVAVPEPARALFAATLARATARRPIVVAVPTGVEAERIAADLREFLGDDAVELFPAWETLPFERVSPATETMGRRLRVIWRLRAGGEHLPRGRSSRPVRALVQRLGPHVEDVEPVVVRTGAQIDRDELVARLVTIGYRREYQVEARGEVAVRGSIVDVYPVDRRPSGAHRPVGRRGRSPLAVLGRRPAFDGRDRRRRGSSRCASCCRPTRCGPAPASCSQTQPWGREQWERLAEGRHVRRHGVVAAVAHLRRAPAARPAAAVARSSRSSSPGACATARRSCSTRRPRSRETLATTWGATLDRRRRHAAPVAAVRPAARAHEGADRCPCSPRPTHPDTPVLAASAFDPVVGDTDALGQAPQRAARATGSRCSSRPRAAGRADRIEQILADEGVAVDRDHRRSPTAARCCARPACTSSSRRSTAARCCPAQQLALVAEADLTGRRRVHRRPRGARKGARLLRRSRPPATTSCTACTASAATSAWRRRRCSASPATGSSSSSRAATASTSTPRTSASSASTPAARTPKLSKMGGADWEKTRARVRKRGARHRGRARRALPPPARDRRATRSGPTRRSSTRSRSRSRTRRRPTRRKAIVETKADMERPIPMDRLICGDVGYGKTEVALRAAAKAVFDGKQVAILVPTTLLASQHGQTFRERFANYPGARRGALAVPDHRRNRPTSSRACATAPSTSSSARTGCSATTSRSRTSACSSSTRSSASACSTRSGSRRCARTSTCSRSPPRRSRGRSRCRSPASAISRS